MKIYKTKIKRFAGTDYSDIYKKTHIIFKSIKAKSKRRPYIRSRYFGKNKVFFEFFWQHIDQMNWRDKIRRMKYFACAIDLIENSICEPTVKQNPNRQTERLYRFSGMTINNEPFFVQIKEDIKTGNKWLISVFPDEKKDKK